MLSAVAQSPLRGIPNSSLHALARTSTSRIKRSHFTTSAVGSTRLESHPAMQEGAVPPLLHGFIEEMLTKYYDRTPTAAAIISQLRSHSDSLFPARFDHLAFRTFGVGDLGIGSIAGIFTEFGYKQMDELAFPAKKLRATWLQPPSYASGLPRVFISELKVHELSKEAQSTIAKYTSQLGAGAGRHAALCAATGILPWPTPDAGDYDSLAQESEYAAWTLTNGWSLNHTTIAVHHMRKNGFESDIEGLIALLSGQGFHLNEAGGVLKVSPDGGLLQFSTLADDVPFTFAGGETREVPGAYLELAQRQALPQHSHLKEWELLEEQRRDGFETSNADKIFESTNKRAKHAAV